MVGFVYLAGPYSAVGGGYSYQDYEEVDRHIAVARAWMLKLARRGVYCFCPHLHTAHMEVIAPDIGRDYWMGCDLAILRHASAVLTLPGWERSAGACEEVEVARSLGIPVYSVEEYYERLG